MSADLNAATEFIYSTARVLDRRRFEHLFHDGPAEPVVDALRAHANADGGFGHALEPDMRAPVSQPVGIHTAMEILHEVGVRDEAMIARAGDWLQTVTREDGGIPFALPNVTPYPRNPIWQPADESSVIQTGANAAALHALGAGHPWLDGADAFMWQRIETLEASPDDPGSGYELRFSIAFLDAVPDRERAEAALDGLPRDAIAEPGSTGDVQTPLDVSPLPDLRSRRLFDAGTIERGLDELEAGQQPDGGWLVPWGGWNETATLEWRGVLTVNALRVLRAHGRL